MTISSLAMLNPMSLPDPDPAPILDLIEAFRRSKAMFAATSLGVFDRLALSPMTAADLARDLSLVEDPLTRLLDALVGLGLLDRDADALYHNTPLANTYLTRASPASLAGYVNYSNEALYLLWGQLEQALREGTHRWTQVFGPGGSLFSHFFRTEESKYHFLMGMHGFGQISSPAVVRAFDLSRFRRLVDLGGATGHLSIAACELYPDLEAVVFDLPPVVPLAIEQRDRSPAASRIQVQAGDFLKDDLPHGDLCALGRILHDWSEPKIHSLLTRIRQALPPHGALLIAEKLLDNDKRGPLFAQLQSLNMLVCTEGKERTVAEYEALLKQVGFAYLEARQTGAPLDAMLAYAEHP